MTGKDVLKITHKLETAFWDIIDSEHIPMDDNEIEAICRSFEDILKGNI